MATRQMGCMGARPGVPAKPLGFVGWESTGEASRPGTLVRQSDGAATAGRKLASTTSIRRSMSHGPSLLTWLMTWGRL